MPDVLNVESTVQCPHGGTVNLSTTNSRVRVDGALAMIVGDTSTVTGCPFNTGTNPSPCVTVLWLSGAGLASAGALPLYPSPLCLSFYPPPLSPRGALLSPT